MHICCWVSQWRTKLLLNGAIAILLFIYQTIDINHRCSYRSIETELIYQQAISKYSFHTTFFFIFEEQIVEKHFQPYMLHIQSICSTNQYPSYLEDNYIHPSYHIKVVQNISYLLKVSKFGIIGFDDGVQSLRLEK